MTIMDVNAIAAGDDFAVVLQQALDSCAVVLTTIGARWATGTDERGRRLDNPNDYVRMEITTAQDLDELTGITATESLPDTHEVRSIPA